MRLWIWPNSSSCTFERKRFTKCAQLASTDCRDQLSERYTGSHCKLHVGRTLVRMDGCIIEATPAGGHRINSAIKCCVNRHLRIEATPAGGHRINSAVKCCVNRHLRVLTCSAIRDLGDRHAFLCDSALIWAQKIPEMRSIGFD